MWGKPVFLLGFQKMLSTQLSFRQLVSVCVSVCVCVCVCVSVCVCVGGGIGNPPYAAMFKAFPRVLSSNHNLDNGKV